MRTHVMSSPDPAPQHPEADGAPQPRVARRDRSTHRVAAIIALAAMLIGLIEPAWPPAAAAAASSTESSVVAGATVGGAPAPGVDGGAGAAAAIACGLGARAIVLIGPIFGLVLATVAVCTYALFEGAIDPTP